ncbi:MAG: hypothetical protein WC787_03680 [Patescibacteria group bacterium]|jgi:Na+/glutamate symporter
MTLPPFLRPSYWFALSPPPLMPWVEWTLLGLFTVCFFAGVILRLISMRQGMEKMTRRTYERGSNMLMILGLFGFLLFVLSFERIYMIGMRAGYLLWVALLGWFAYRMYTIVRVDMPAMEKRKADREAINKWLPTSKK